MEFLRRKWSKYSKFGSGGRPNKRKWRKPKGRDNKMREKNKGYPPVVSIGYRTKKTERMNFPVIRTIRDLEKVEKGVIVVIGKIGMKKKLEIVEKAKSMNLIVQNINVRRFLRKNKKADKETKNESK